MLIGNHELAFGYQHAVGFDAADHAFLETDTGAGNIGAGVHEDAGHSGTGVRRAADDLNLAPVGLDEANAETVGVGVLLGLLHAGHGEGSECCHAVDDFLDFKADPEQSLDDGVETCLGIEMLLQPRKSEFHDRPPARVGTSVKEKP